MRTDRLVSEVAEALGLQIIGQQLEGEFGAARVVDANGSASILKVFLSPEQVVQYAKGIKLADRLRAIGYPIPRYLGTGVINDASWCLQEIVPGEVPEVMTEAYARRLLELVSMHEGMAPTTHRWEDEALVRMHDLVDFHIQYEETASLAQEIQALLGRLERAEFLHDGIVHGDFHHRNYLVQNDEITAVVDWEGATAGDWHWDLVNISCWSSVVSWQVPREVAKLFIERAEEVCSRDQLAFLSAYWALANLEFRLQVHPHQLPWLIAAVDEKSGTLVAKNLAGHSVREVADPWGTLQVLER